MEQSRLSTAEHILQRLRFVLKKCQIVTDGYWWTGLAVPRIIAILVRRRLVLRKHKRSRDELEYSIRTNIFYNSWWLPSFLCAQCTHRLFAISCSIFYHRGFDSRYFAESIKLYSPVWSPSRREEYTGGFAFTDVGIGVRTAGWGSLIFIPSTGHFCALFYTAATSQFPDNFRGYLIPVGQQTEIKMKLHFWRVRGRTFGSDERLSRPFMI